MRIWSWCLVKPFVLCHNRTTKKAAHTKVKGIKTESSLYEEFIGSLSHAQWLTLSHHDDFSPFRRAVAPRPNWHPRPCLLLLPFGQLNFSMSFRKNITTTALRKLSFEELEPLEGLTNWRLRMTLNLDMRGLLMSWQGKIWLDRKLRSMIDSLGMVSSDLSLCIQTLSHVDQSLSVSPTECSSMDM